MHPYFRIALLSPAILLASCESGNAPREHGSVAASNTTPAHDTMTVAMAAPEGTDNHMQETEQLLQQKLQSMYKADLDKQLIDSASRNFIFYEQDLNGDQKPEIFVGMMGSYFCGSGGCNVLLFNADGTLNTRFTVTRTPIIVSASKTHEWNDLLLYSSGKNRLVKYNGKAYPSNPSVQPAFKEAPDATWPKVLDYPNAAYHESRF